MSIQIQHLYFSYPEKEIFHDLCLTLPETGLVIILGKSGSGKTTLLSLLSSTLKPDSGTILGLESNPAMVFQSPILLNYLTVEENIAFPLMLKGKSNTETKDKTQEMLKLLGIASLKDKFPYHLSGGEQIRVSIARALVKGSRTLILDEPTGQLDEKNSHIIYRLLKELAKDHLIILVTHDEKNASELADWLYVLQDGKLLTKKEGKFSLSLPPDEKNKKEKKGKLSLQNSYHINKKYVGKRKGRIFFSTLFLAFTMMLVYLGLNLYFHMDQSMDSLLEEYYAYSETNISLSEEIASSGSLHLKKKRIPTTEVYSILGIKKTYSDLSYFFPNYYDVSLGRQSSSVAFLPVIEEHEEKLRVGHRIKALNQVIVNDSFLAELNLKEAEVLGAKFSFVHQALMKSNQLSASDLISFSLTMEIVGISREKKAFNSAAVYYSHDYLCQNLARRNLPHISQELGKTTTVLNMLNDSRYDEDDFKSNAVYFLSQDVSYVKERGEKYFPNQLSITSTALSVKESTEEILSSLLKILLIFLLLNITSAFMMEFLSVYSLYRDNVRLFALVKVFSGERKDILRAASGTMIIYLALAVSFTLFLSLLFSFGINALLNAFLYPSFLASFDVVSFAIVFWLCAFCSLLASLFPLQRIKDKEIKKELEGED